jgi:hypothetical protein
MNVISKSQHLSPMQFARALGYTGNYVYSLLSAGRIEASKRAGRWLIPAKEVERRKEIRRNDPRVRSDA